ncbi:MAG TPA: LuxR C-terminal-related transcriptional regulator [Candidatus Dormibacteraeota bacterium]|nr:LuxR C-terminal-related transcriptional regulator [Candidatus Dormibacteraeota bacterium]
MSASSSGGGPARLSRREMEVARLVAEGLTNREIATRLFLSERTVDGHLEHVREKLGVNSRAQVAAWVTKQGEAPVLPTAPAPPTARAGALQRISKRWWVAGSAVLLVVVEAVVVLQVVESQGPTIVTVAGADPGKQNYPTGGNTGDGGLATNAALALPSDVAIASNGFYIADYRNLRVRFVDRATRHIETVAGGGALPLKQGSVATSVKLGFPSNVAVDGRGHLYFLTNENQDLQVWTVDDAGLVQPVVQLPPSGNEPADFFADPVGALAIATDGTIYIADRAGSRIWRTSTGNAAPAPFAGTGHYGYSGDSGPATAAMIDSPVGLALDEKRGYLYFADGGNSCIRRISLTADVISRFAGSCQAFGDTGDGGPANQATLSIPAGVAVGRNGTVFISDTGNYRVREVTPAGTIVGLAGTAKASSTAMACPQGTRLSAPRRRWLSIDPTATCS